LFAAAGRAFSSGSAYDVAVIGGGPGGYVAAIKAAQLGLKTVCVEKRGTLGGTCLNVGCIPSKALLHASHKYEEIVKGHLKGYGIEATATMDFGGMMKSKEKAVTGLTKGIEGLFKKNKVDYVVGHGTITGPNTLTAEGQTIEAKNIIIATGSEPSPLPGVPVEVDEKRVVTSTGALSLPEVPKKMIVIGGGVIGLELGSVWCRLGSEVTVIEFMKDICAVADGEVIKSFTRILKKQGMKMATSTKVVGVDVKPDTIVVATEPSPGAKGEPKDFEADVVLLAVGRRPYTNNLGLDTVGITTDRLGRIEVDKSFKTKVPSIWAIGDVIDGPMLAHKAEEDGVYVVEQIAGKYAHVNWDTVPSVIYTSPEVAWVGKTEEQLAKEGVEFKKASFPLMANSRARANDEGTDGFVKVITEKATNKLLAAHIIAPMAGDMILPLTIGVEYGASAEDIARTCTPHPTVSEAIKEACLGIHAKPIHF
jgi:dihydrolipoamide dehydrogenase